MNSVHAFRRNSIIFSGYDEYMPDTLIPGGYVAGLFYCQMASESFRV